MPGYRIPDLRWLFLGFGLAMHVGIQLGVYVVFFAPLIVGAYLSFFDADELRSAADRLRRVWRRLLPSRT